MNEHNLNNLDEISTRIRLKYNAPKPHTPDAIELYVEALKEFNNKRERRYSANIPSTN